MAWSMTHFVCYSTIITLIYLSHLRAMWSDPGLVPLDPSDAARYQERFGTEEQVPARLYCKKCQCFRPDSAHHCSRCNRCVRKMDHHCPWVNNCVGEYNLKYFLLFLMHVGLGSAYSIILLSWRAYTALSTRAPRVEFVRGHNPMHIDPLGLFVGVVATLLSIIFLVFVSCMWCDQKEALVTGTPGIDALQGHDDPDERRTILEGLCETCGERPSWRWPLPIPPPGGFAAAAAAKQKQKSE